MTGETAPAVPTRLPWGLAWRLAFGQIVAWGIVYYSFSVVVGPIATETGWSRSLLNAGLSLGLLLSGVTAVAVGGWIQRRGGRGVMTLGSLLSGAALAGLAAVHEPWQYLLAWAVMGGAMAAVLYDPAFAVVTAAFGPEYRRGITLLTLVAGFASTVFIPLTQLAVDAWGWRAALTVFGAIQAAVGGPLHFWGIPRFIPSAAPPPGRRRDEVLGWLRALRRDIADPRYLGLALWFAGYSAAFAGVIFQLLPIFEARSADPGVVIAAIALFGPMQVAGRFALALRGGNFPTLRVGWWAMSALALAMALVLVCPPRFGWLALFAALFGLGNGVMTILRGTAVGEIFGRERYAEINGSLSLPALVARAASPFLLSACWSLTGEPRAVFVGVLALLSVGALGLLLASRAAGRTNRDRRRCGGGA